jgi:HAE1 family hydrophobic/amphiphilic exporter-1
MTTATTVLGLLPMALGLGDGAEIRTPLAITVISGLIVSTGLTLLVIPTMYYLADRAKERALVAVRGGRALADEEEDQDQDQDQDRDPTDEEPAG